MPSEARLIFWLHYTGIYPMSVLFQVMDKKKTLLPSLCTGGRKGIRPLVARISSLPIPLLRGVKEVRQRPETKGCVVVTPEVMQQLGETIGRIRMIDRLRQEKEEKIRKKKMPDERAKLSRERFEAWKDRPERFQRPKDTPRQRQNDKVSRNSLHTNQISEQRLRHVGAPGPSSKTSSRRSRGKRKRDRCDDASAVAKKKKRVPADLKVHVQKAEASSSTVAVTNNQSQVPQKKYKTAGAGNDRALKKNRTSSPLNPRALPLPRKVHEQCHLDQLGSIKCRWPRGLQEFDSAKARQFKRNVTAQSKAMFQSLGYVEGGILGLQLPPVWMMSHQQRWWKWHCTLARIPEVKASRRGSLLRFEV